MTSAPAPIPAQNSPARATADAPPIRLCLFQPALPKYRLPIFRELAGRPGIDLSEYINPNDAPYRVHTKHLVGDGIGFTHFAARLGAPREPESDISDQHKNIAFAVQDACEIAMMSVVKLALEKTKSKNLCLAGGVALNSKANGKIVASGLVRQVFVQPAAADDGVALGAALAPYLDGNGKLPNKAMRHGYWGPAFDDEAIEKALQTYKIRHTKLSDAAATA